MKRLIALMVVCFSVILLLTACGNETVEKPIVQQIDEQLTGTWSSKDSDKVSSKWTFYEGQYVVDTYINNEKIENSIVGTYSIGSDAIHTVTIDQKNNVEGSIPFSFVNGKLTLHGANGDLKKE